MGNKRNKTLQFQEQIQLKFYLNDNFLLNYKSLIGQIPIQN